MTKICHCDDDESKNDILLKVEERVRETAHLHAMNVKKAPKNSNRNDFLTIFFGACVVLMTLATICLLCVK